MTTAITTGTEAFAELNFGKKLHDFYHRAMHDYKYVIIVPRKCMTEYKCLRLKHNDLEFSGDNYYMTSKSFIQYRELMLEDIRRKRPFSIAIVDDIMMFGRGINAVLKSLVKGLPDDLRQQMIDHIYIEVFIESNKDFLLDEEFMPIWEERYNRYISYNHFNNIRQASDLFLKSFYMTAVANTSFVNAWYCRKKAVVLNEGKLELASAKKTKVSCLASYHVERNQDQRNCGFYSDIYYSSRKFWMEAWELKNGLMPIWRMIL